MRRESHKAARTNATPFFELRDRKGRLKPASAGLLKKAGRFGWAIYGARARL